ncbi:STAS domain-containing protein [Desulfobacter curvatus]|uniref:STAS domain-containing protein n=1 Tax=Desulfobacter curvatus TaxID=2290 RepID=UPI0003744889|nr:STAS domain-containing protein [Desulfobacter curvatus]
MSEIVTSADQTVVKPGEDVVASMAEAFKAELMSAVDSSQGTLIIDLDGVSMVDSVGIGVIIAAYNSLSQSNRQLKVINVAQDIYGLFSTMRLNRRFTVDAAE